MSHPRYDDSSVSRRVAECGSRVRADSPMALLRGLAFRSRWHIEDDTYRELKVGWGRDVAAALGGTTLTCLAFNSAQASRLQAGGPVKKRRRTSASVG